MPIDVSGSQAFRYNARYDARRPVSSPDRTSPYAPIGPCFIPPTGPARVLDCVPNRCLPNGLRNPWALYAGESYNPSSEAAAHIQAGHYVGAGSVSANGEYGYGYGYRRGGLGSLGGSHGVVAGSLRGGWGEVGAPDPVYGASLMYGPGSHLALGEGGLGGYRADDGWYVELYFPTLICVLQLIWEIGMDQ